ncbi:MAG: sensor histidine kinase [Candidatus Nitrosocosmicus sp.]
MSNPTNRQYRIVPETEIAVGIDNGIKWHSFAKNTSDACLDYKGPRIFVDYKPFWESLNRMKKRGVKMRFITDIRKENIVYCKKLLEVGEIGHIEAFNGNWGILDGIHYLGPALSQHTDPIVPILIRISIKDFVDSHQDLFNSLWNKAIPVEQKIMEIEKGIIPPKIETMTDPSEIETTYIRLLETATDEILLIFPTLNSMQRQLHIGVFQALKENINQHRDLKIRILSPFLSSSLPLSSSPLYKETLKEKISQEFELNNISTYKNNVSIRNIEPSLSTKSTILVVDRKESLVMEIKDDLKEIFSDSVGFGTYSNSYTTVLSYVSIFESFWSYSEVVEKLKESEELQKDFIRLAAHELKNPIQPLLSLSDILQSKIKDTEYCKMLNIINRNAKKLKQLTNDILDVTKIETKNFSLSKEIFDLNELICDIVEDYRNQINNSSVSYTFDNYVGTHYKTNSEGNKDSSKNAFPSLPSFKSSSSSLSIFGDKSRVTQVISNLLDNAIRFTKQGSIDVVVKKRENDKEIIINIRDTGSGIDSEIYPRLFTKFATNSDKGTGLGLYISKNIIEAHGGNIWAKNNENGKGATFSFSLPLVNQRLKEL